MESNESYVVIQAKSIWQVVWIHTCLDRMVGLPMIESPVWPNILPVAEEEKRKEEK